MTMTATDATIQQDLERMATNALNCYGDPAKVRAGMQTLRGAIRSGSINGQLGTVFRRHMADHDEQPQGCAIGWIAVGARDSLSDESFEQRSSDFRAICGPDREMPEDGIEFLLFGVCCGELPQENTGLALLDRAVVAWLEAHPATA